MIQNLCHKRGKGEQRRGGGGHGDKSDTATVASWRKRGSIHLGEIEGVKGNGNFLGKSGKSAEVQTNHVQS